MTRYFVLSISDIFPFGITVAVVGYITVFLALVILYFVFSNIPGIIRLNIRKKLRKQGREKEIADGDMQIAGEVNAAIAAALYLHFSEVHDQESAVLTIKKRSREYSPWSSKIHSVNEYFKN